jgi:hypothetical protein
MWPADDPLGDGSTTALASLILQRLPAAVREPVELPEDDVDNPLDVLEDEAVVLGAGVGVGGELLHAASDAARPAAATAPHTERAVSEPCVVTPPR